MLLHDVGYSHSVCCYTISGTGISYAATQYPVLAKRMLLNDVRYGIAYATTRYPVLRYSVCPVLKSGMLLPGYSTASAQYGLRPRTVASFPAWYRPPLVCDVRYWYRVCGYALATCVSGPDTHPPTHLLLRDFRY
eukprot:2954765-Rhodomonas_salina.1